MNTEKLNALGQELQRAMERAEMRKQDGPNRVTLIPGDVVYCIDSYGLLNLRSRGIYTVRFTADLPPAGMNSIRVKEYPSRKYHPRRQFRLATVQECETRGAEYNRERQLLGEDSV